ncbi:MAG: hypothetical protein GF398_04650 [Chitinivibrionales bacterium]|nr:hypothetical protein [Chitinivibrionales bacterium]
MRIARRSGLSVLEVLVAMAILSGLLVAIAGYLSSGDRFRAMRSRHSYTVIAAQNQIEYMRTNAAYTKYFEDTLYETAINNRIYEVSRTRILSEEDAYGLVDEEPETLHEYEISVRHIDSNAKPLKVRFIQGFGK